MEVGFEDVVVGERQVGSELVNVERWTIAQRFATSNSDAALPNVPSHPPQGYGFGWGTRSHTHTRTPAYPGPIPARVSIPMSITSRRTSRLFVTADWASERGIQVFHKENAPKGMNEQMGEE